MDREGKEGGVSDARLGEGRGNAKVFGWLKEGMMWLPSLGRKAEEKREHLMEEEEEERDGDEEKEMGW